ncbi:hypothetical protein [Halobaculum sp. MBLA0143]|uniref:hypothetical protein n=1 Tax=Halobaculum sp. MBLA0143 TaxID=3079933 RepID=UPI003524A3E3
MLTDTTRRRFLGVAAALSAGCAARPGRRADAGGTETTDRGASDTSTPTTDGSETTETASPAPSLPERTLADPPEGPESYPDRPDGDGPGAAVAFVRQFEHAQGYNVLHEPDAESISVQPAAEHVRSVEPGGHYVLGRRSGYANYADGVHADLGSAPRLYFVSPRYVVRVGEEDDRLRDCTTVPAADDPADNFAAKCSGDDARYAVVNLAPETREMVVEVSRADTGATVGRESYRLVPGRLVVFDGVTRRRGRYRLTVTAGDRETTAAWDLRNGPRERPPVVVSTPRRRLAVERFDGWPY